MKKYIYILIFILGTGTFSWIHYKSIKNDYTQKVQNVDMKRLGGMDKAVTWLDKCFGDYNYNLHDELITMVPDEYMRNRTGKTFLELFFPDSLNKCGNILTYVPLYNRKNKKKESFILISAGIDGKLNTEYNVGDTIYDDEYLNKFNFYNTTEYAGRKSLKFDLINYIFGKKDYLVRFYNCINEGHYAPQIIEYYNYRERLPSQNQSISVIAAFDKDTIVGDTSMIVLKSWMDNYKVYCNMHNSAAINFHIGDTLTISGYVQKIDEDRNFHISHCAFTANPAERKAIEILNFSKLGKRELKKRDVILNN